MKHVWSPRFSPDLRSRLVVGFLIATVSWDAAAQSGAPTRSRPTAGAAQPARTRGIWEPVSYPADIRFNDVYFVSPEIGWATSGAHGEGGMLLRTTNAGANWEVQLGDHESQEPVFHHLYFIDAKLGWVLQNAGPLKYKLLRTTDGENWGQVGTIELQWGLADYTFLDRNVGLFVNSNDNASQIMRTTNGGRTWSEVFRCRTQLEVQGLKRNIDCSLTAMHFPTPSVGYAIGVESGTLIVVKTTDAGVTWQLSQVEIEVEPGYEDEDLFFTDENTGIARLPGGRIYRTTDGGATWTGAVGTPGPIIRFADPEVGWSFHSFRALSHTTDGGRRWLSRQQPFPAPVTAFSIPRRDRAFVVGEHGMAYRYRVVPTSTPTPPRAIEAPVMPTVDSELDDQVEEFEEELETIEKAIEDAMDDKPADSPAAAGGAADTIAFVDACCAKRANELQATIDALTPLLQRFAGRYRNVNLILAGLKLLGVMPDQVADVRAKLKTLRRAVGPAAAATALAEVTASLEQLKQTTRYAFQQDPPVMGDEGGAVPAGSAKPSAIEPADDAKPAASRARPADAKAGGDSAKQAGDDAAKKAADEAKKRAQDALRKRVRIRIP